MAGPLTVEGGRGVVPPSLLSPLAGPGEVETEFEDEGEDDEEDQEHEPLEEVEEELSQEGDEDADGRVTPGGASDAPTETYVVPEGNTEVWKKFGCDTEAGRALRKLYAGVGASGAAGASKVSYPRLKAPAERWQPKPKERKPCPQRAPVRVPVARPKLLDRDDPKNWRVPVPCRKPADQILAEMEASAPQVPDMVPGRNQAAEKKGLADRFQFCGGRMMPRGAMGHVEGSEDLPKHVGPTLREMAEARKALDDNGMNAEHRGIFEELMLAVARKQERMKEIDEQNAADPKPCKARTDRNKEALQLRNDIDRCMKDIDKLMELTDA